mmetsp:Transcript_6155/g.7595  ORF Transcript_6155/g.7595 Transcript_6155/m.7595 type:complete len:88 (+) Transcript_6155:356-619(+)
MCNMLVLWIFTLLIGASITVQSNCHLSFDITNGQCELCTIKECITKAESTECESVDLTITSSSSISGEGNSNIVIENDLIKSDSLTP